MSEQTTSSYRAIVENTHGLDLCFWKGEFLFYWTDWIVSVIQTAGLPTQTLFVVFSALFLTFGAYTIKCFTVMAN